MATTPTVTVDGITYDLFYQPRRRYGKDTYTEVSVWREDEKLFFVGYYGAMGDTMAFFTPRIRRELAKREEAALLATDRAAQDSELGVM